MRRLAFAVLFFLSACACGSTYIAEPEPWDPAEQCVDVERTLVGKTISTPFPIPFPTSTRDFKLYTARPDGWDEFSGAIRLRRMSWDVVWIQNGFVLVDGLTVAVLEDGRWSTSMNVDIARAVKEDGDWLVFEAKLKGSGIKPAGAQTISVTVVAAFCGDGREAVADGFARLEDWQVR